MNNYLIPANSKRSMLWFGLFTPFDMAIFATGIGLTFFLLLIIKAESLWQVLLILFPGLTGAFLVLPIPNYHNVLTIIKSVYKFYTTNQRLKWKGWCYLDGKQK
ncbi:MAG: hypothetical protein IJZ36_02715 [Bacilli bacterium]|nr:hypothetical protein [Bacilli bacterium]